MMRNNRKPARARLEAILDGQIVDGDPVATLIESARGPASA